MVASEVYSAWLLSFDFLKSKCNIPMTNADTYTTISTYAL